MRKETPSKQDKSLFGEIELPHTPEVVIWKSLENMHPKTLFGDEISDIEIPLIKIEFSEKYEAETEKVKKDIDSAKDAIARHENIFQPIFRAMTSKDSIYSRIDQSQKKYAALRALGGTIHKNILPKLHLRNNEDKVKIYVLEFGRQRAIAETLRLIFSQCKSIMEPIPELETSIQLRLFQNASPILNKASQSASLFELSNGYFKTNDHPNDMVNAYLRTYLAPCDTMISPEQIEKTSRIYPEMSLAANMISSNLSRIILGVNSQEALYPKDVSDETIREVLAYSKSGLDKLRKDRLHIRNTLLEKSNPYSEDLSKYLSDLTTAPDNTVDFLLYFTGIMDSEEIVQTYRTIKAIQKKGNRGKIYSRASEKIETTITNQDNEPILRGIDLLDIFDEGNCATRDTQRIERIRRNIHTTFQKSSTEEYDVSNTQLNGTGFMQADTIRIKFNKNKPLEFSIELFYENDKGDSTKLHVNYNLGKGKEVYEWNVLDEIAQNEKILNSIHSVVEKATQETIQQSSNKYIKRNSTQETTPQIHAKSKRFRIIPEAEQQQTHSGPRRIKEDKKSQAKIKTEVEQQSAIQLKKTIRVPEGESLAKFTKGIATKDQETIGKVLREFNEFGTGKFYRLKQSRLKDDKGTTIKLFSLAVGNSIRILAYELDGQSGERTFEIYDIDYRKDIYKRNNISTK